MLCMTTFRLSAISFFCLLLIHCKPKKKFQATSELFHHWTNKDSLHPKGFVISLDSFFYPYYNRSFPYLIDKDSIEVIFPDKTSKSAYKIEADTLILTSKEGTETFWRKR